MLHSQRGVGRATNIDSATNYRGRSAWGLHHTLRYWRDASIGRGAGSGRNIGCWSSSSGSRSGRCLLLGLENGCSNLL